MTDSQTVEILYEDDNGVIAIHPDHENATVLMRNPGHRPEGFVAAMRGLVDRGYLYLDDEYYDSQAEGIVLVLTRSDRG